MKAKFDDNSSNYSYSNLYSKCIEWLRKKDIDVISRKIDLTALNGYKYFAAPILSEIAPLTLDEYRKYVDIINPIIKQNFWLSTAWSGPSKSDSNSICFVGRNGNISSTYCHDDTVNVYPAFVLDSSSTSRTLSQFTTQELAAELNRRLAETEV
jgi:hypothetical protein